MGMACVKVELSNQNRKAGATLFAMNQRNTALQRLLSAIKPPDRISTAGAKSVTVQYTPSRTALTGFASHPRQHTDDELKLIQAT